MDMELSFRRNPLLKLSGWTFDIDIICENGSGDLKRKYLNF